MLAQSLYCLQVMPEFIDLILPLGERRNAQDFYSNQFEQHTRLSDATISLHIPERAWSGRDFQLCYSLKSVERSEIQFDWPWSIRHGSIHHTFDVTNVRSAWVIVKGDRLIEDRITSATRGRGPPGFSSYQTVEQAFAAALLTHLIVIDWSAENWRWYLNFLEDKFREVTEGAICTDADIPLSPQEAEDVFGLGPRTNTQNTNQTRKSRTFSFRSATRKVNTLPSVTEMQVLPPQRFITNPRSGKKQPLPPGITTTEPDASRKNDVQYDSYGQPMFRFRHLQDIQDFEESANEIVLVLKLNVNICEQILQFYKSLFYNKELPETVIHNCRESMLRFERRINSVKSHMNTQILRVEGLLRLIADRKSLVSLNFIVFEELLGAQAYHVEADGLQLYGLLDFQNTRSNKLLASESQKSSKKMEKVTNEMSKIARKTKTETVSMKIITLVTLFFLPGTFIAVSGLLLLCLVSLCIASPFAVHQLFSACLCRPIYFTNAFRCVKSMKRHKYSTNITLAPTLQTLMSTDIIHWNNGIKNYQSGALQIYLAVCIPLMVATFVVWGAFQWHERRKERLADEEADLPQPIQATKIGHFKAVRGAFRSTVKALKNLILSRSLAIIK